MQFVPVEEPNKKDNPTPKVDSDTVVQKAEEEKKLKLIRQETAEAEVAIAEAEIRVKLAKDGYESLEQAKKAVADKEKEWHDKLDQLEKKEAELGEKIMEVGKKIAEANNAHQEWKRRDEIVKKRLEDSVKIKHESESIMKVADDFKRELQNCVLYFNGNILPIVKELRLIKKAVYVEAENWQKNEKLWDLHEYVSKHIVRIEGMIAMMSPVIPEAFIPPNVAEGEPSGDGSGNFPELESSVSPLSPDNLE